MSYVPRILNCAAVKVLATLDDARGTGRSGNNRARKALLNDVAQLAICQKNGESNYQMFFCDEDWATLSTKCFDSIELATSYAEREFPGINKNWMSPSVASERRC